MTRSTQYVTWLGLPVRTPSGSCWIICAIRLLPYVRLLVRALIRNAELRWDPLSCIRERVLEESQLTLHRALSQRTEHKKYQVSYRMYYSTNVVPERIILLTDGWTR